VNKFFSHKIAFELSAFLAGIVFVIISFFTVSNGLEKTKKPSSQKEVFKLKEPSTNRGVIANYTDGLASEMALMSSLSRPNQLTLFGSSEFSSNENASYFYFPLKVGVPAVGFGHAHHQSFSMFCELLAGNEYLDGSKVIIFLSPGWFESEGTNPEAFLEFVPPHFLEKIWVDKSISKEYKIEIGRYISKNVDLFSGLTQRMQSFMTLYQSECEINLVPKFRTKIQSNFPFLKKETNIRYDVRTVPNVQRIKVPNFKTLQNIARANFMKTCTNNNLYVDSAYYNEYLVKPDGSWEGKNVEKLTLSENAEYKDFMLLLTLLKEKKVNCSFIIQCSNPYYYVNLDNLDPLIRGIVGELEDANIPYLNMFTSKRSNYQPGVLNDVMHLGNLGWMQVNEFIYNTYIK
jgi:D-alanine transfer protein